MKSSFRMWCTIGLILSAYATYVEIRAEGDDGYVAWCDIIKKVNCKAVFTSDFGKGFGLLQYFIGSWSPPNGVLGIIFYILLLLSTLTPNCRISKMRAYCCMFSDLLSLYVGYLLFYVLGELCVICLSIYIVNYFCLVESLILHSQLPEKLVKPNMQSAAVSKND